MGSPTIGSPFDDVPVGGGIPTGQLPDPTLDDEKSYVRFVLETPDDRGIEPHLDAIAQALGRWCHLLDAETETTPQLTPRVPSNIRIRDDIRLPPVLHPDDPNLRPFPDVPLIRPSQGKRFFRWMTFVSPGRLKRAQCFRRGR
ncbi:hypothetical protein CAI21_18205 [Alkalilimnicola ehrlichii]|uniref:Uncharacterized protein n=1 Tax=Alkalilimnicola ehrlichii TaxID=351052 RepID=A0A3E0WQK7_9GAMM|nr:hypothetical protein [Alkalilimnicola ehrlichii]RFA25791.1 hypothetical protein CAI21_18205 [Alkalilimnicola ehrlichii]RFA35108.1 hypothetical protein CAL65_13440 [Alkalilimnicola ehrlichii]